MAGIVLVCYMTVLVFIGHASCRVSLSSTVTGGKAHLGDTVNFYCRTVGSNTLAWRSNEYIGQNGEQLSLSLLGSTSLNSYAVATLNNSYVEDGQIVLESTFTIIVQGNIPSASVTCVSLGTRESNMTSFSLAENPTLSYGDHMVCPGEKRTFICETRGSNSLAWESEQYIGPGGLRLVFSILSHPGDTMDSIINSNVSASLMTNYETNGVSVLRSTLTIVVSGDILDDVQHLVTCVNVGLGTKEDSSLQLEVDGTCGFTLPTESETTLQNVSNTGPTEVGAPGNLVTAQVRYIIIGCGVGCVAAVLILSVLVMVVAINHKKKHQRGVKKELIQDGILQMFKVDNSVKEIKS